MFDSMQFFVVLYFLYTFIFLTNEEQYSSSDTPCFIQPLVKFGKKQLYFGTNFKGNFFESSDFCRRHCMQLVSINSEEENNAIVNYLKSGAYRNEDFWTSGNDLGEEGIFTWASTGQRVTYTNWSAGNPNNELRDCVGENCLHLWGWGNHRHEWNDHICTEKMFFICEINL